MTRQIHNPAEPPVRVVRQLLLDVTVENLVSLRPTREHLRRARNRSQAPTTNPHFPIPRFLATLGPEKSSHPTKIPVEE